MKKTIINFLAVLLAMIMLVSCGKTESKKSKKPKNKTITQTEEIDDLLDIEDDEEMEEDFDDWIDEEIEDDDFVMEEDAASVDFSMLHIVYESKASTKRQYLVDTFSQRLNEKYFISNYDDSTPVNDEKHEIIIGNTNRPESAQTLKILTDYRKNCDADFIIMEKNGNIVINATSNYALDRALEYFKKTFCKDEFTSEVPEKYYFHHKAKLSATSATIANMNINQYSIVTKRDMSFVYSKDIDTLVQYICSVSGIEIPIVDDREKTGKYEILIGKTNRTESNVTHTDEAEYSIALSGQKIVITAGSDIALSGAVEKFTANLKNAVTERGNISVTSLHEKGFCKPEKKEYQLVWKDEFEGTELDLSKWKRVTQVDTAWDGAVCKRTADTKNSYIKDGKLIIEGLQEENGDYSSAKLSTADSLSFRYGYFEIRARLPEGAGVWPGFWSVPTTPIFPEIDVFEMFGISNQIQFTLHKWWPSTSGGIGGDSPQDIYYPDTTKIVELKNGEKYSDAFHTIGCEWTPEHIALYVDGFKYTECNIQAEGMDVFHHPIGVILSMAIGLTGIMKPDETTVWPARFEIDYFRLYQIPGVGSITKK